MAGPKKNQLLQFVIPMVDKTDFVSIESAITAASVTGRYYGVNHGGSVATTSGAMSKAFSVVRSGVVRATAKATEANYDYVLFRISHTSCADQFFPFNLADNDDSDIMSALTVIQSMASDAHSAAAQANSRALVVQSIASDTQSNVLYNRSAISDLASYLVALSATISDTHSAAVQANSRILVVQSNLSDVQSALTVVQSMASDAHSAAAQANSRALVLSLIHI